MDTVQVGLSQRILAATSEEEIKELFMEGAGYKQASDKTKRRWQRVAERALARIHAHPDK